MAITDKSRAREIGCGLKSLPLTAYNTAIQNPASGDFTRFTAFEHLTTTDRYVAIIEEYSKNDMDLRIHNFPANSIIPISGHMAYNVGTALTDGGGSTAIGSLSTATYSLTNITPIGDDTYFFLSVYAAVPFYLKTLTGVQCINNPKCQSVNTPLAAGSHLLMFITTDTTSRSILFKNVADGTPTGLAVVGLPCTAWTAMQANGII